MNELLVKVSNNARNNTIAVKEIPIKQHDTLITRKLDLDEDEFTGDAVPDLDNV